MLGSSLAEDGGHSDQGYILMSASGLHTYTHTHKTVLPPSLSDTDSLIPSLATETHAFHSITGSLTLPHRSLHIPSVESNSVQISNPFSSSTIFRKVEGVLALWKLSPGEI